MRPSKDYIKVLAFGLIIFALTYFPLSHFIKEEILNAETIVEGKVYQGQANGYNGPITVEVTMIEEKIKTIQVINHVDDYDWYIKAKQQVIPAIIDAQSTKVDVVSGATYSSNGIIEAVNDALLKVGD